MLLSKVVTADVCGHYEEMLARLLMDGLADVNSTDHNRMTPLHNATKSSNKDFVEMLIKRKADVHAVDNRGKSPLHYAWNVGVARSLVAANADLDAPDADGNGAG